MKKYMHSHTNSSVSLPDYDALEPKSLPYRKGTISQPPIYIPQGKASPLSELYIYANGACAPYLYEWSCHVSMASNADSYMSAKRARLAGRAGSGD